MERIDVEIPKFMEDNNKKVKDRYAAARAKSVGSSRMVVRKKKKKVVSNKWLVAAVLATVAVGSMALGTYLQMLHNKQPDVRVENLRKDIEKILADKDVDDINVVNEYKFSENAILMEMAELEQQLEDLEVKLDDLYTEADDKLVESAEVANEGIDALAMTLANDVNGVFGERIDMAIYKCQVPNNSTASNQADDWFYDFSKFNMSEFICNGLSPYSSVCDVVALYNSLTEEEKVSVAVACGYDKIKEFQTDDGELTNNKAYFLFCLGLDNDKQNAEVVVKKAHEDAEKVYLKIANALIGYEYGVDNLDVSVSQVKRGGM